MVLGSGFGRTCYNQFMVVVLFVKCHASETKPQGVSCQHSVGNVSVFFLMSWPNQTHKTTDTISILKLIIKGSDFFYRNAEISRMMIFQSNQKFPIVSFHNTVITTIIVLF